MKLVRRKPLKPLGEQQIRQIYVSEEIGDLLDGKTKFGQFPNVEAERLIGVYSAGYLIRISRKINKRRPDLERLEGPDEVWAFCIRRPVPGWRLLGRFLEKDRLFLTRAWEKNKLAKQYAQAAKQVTEDWSAIFGSAEPLRSLKIEDYLSGVVRDVDVNED